MPAICHLLQGRLFGVGLVAMAAGLPGCRSAAPSPTGPSVGLAIPGFAAGAIPARFASCPGDADRSPAMSWKVLPARAGSVALIAYDRDSPFGTHFVHWLLWNLPATANGLPEGISRQGELPDGSRQGRNGFGDVGYAGPCPPGHAPHHYVFNVYVLDTKIDLPAGSSQDQLVQALAGHEMAGGQIVATFQR